jgi:hypothetical protein
MNSATPIPTLATPHVAPPDAETRIWQAIERSSATFEADRRQLGRLFLELRNLYSERGVRRMSAGHGIFEREIKVRGYKSRTVREWISDFEADRDGTPRSSMKRKARRRKTKNHLSAPVLWKDIYAGPLTAFAALLPAKAAQIAYREAAKILHPDRGGDKAKMQRLNQAWARVKDYYESSAQDLESLNEIM